MDIISWVECIWTKVPTCRFCSHVYENAEGYPSIWVEDKKGEDHLRRLVESHMSFAHRGKRVCYRGKLWSK